MKISAQQHSAQQLFTTPPFGQFRLPGPQTNQAFQDAAADHKTYRCSKYVAMTGFEG